MIHNRARPLVSRVQLFLDVEEMNTISPWPTPAWTKSIWTPLGNYVFIVARHAYKHVGGIQTRQNGLACWIFFHFEFSTLQADNLISIKWRGIFSFLTHYPVHISINIQHDIFPSWDLKCFQTVPWILLKLCVFCCKYCAIPLPLYAWGYLVIKYECIWLYSSYQSH